MSEQFVRTPLWPHQARVVEEFEGVSRVLCAWDMGTGKTLFAIERDLRIRDYFGNPHFKTLVVCPTATFEQWEDAWNREAPHLTTKVIDRKKRDAFLLGQSADVYIMHWEAIHLMPELRNVFDHGIMDECHYIKNRKAKVTRATKRLGIKLLTDMSGSPADNRPADLWSILEHLKPRTYTSYNRFIDEFVSFEWTFDEEDGMPKYRTLAGPSPAWKQRGLPAIRPFYSRVTLDEVLPDLPPFVENEVYVDLSPAQRRAYNEMDKKMIAWVKDEYGFDTPLTAPAVIAKLQRLQQFALAQMMLNSEKDKWTMTLPSTKIDAAVQLIEQASPDQFVVWSQFKAPLHLLSWELQRRGITNVMYTGDVDQQGRQDARRAFIQGKAQCFLATIRAGGTGLDGLQGAAHRMIFLDIDWSPKKNDQARARLRRGGQKNTVFVTYILARNTVDLMRGKVVGMKREWLLEMLGDK